MNLVLPVLAYLVNPMTYFILDEEFEAPADTLIVVDTANAIALIDGNHVEVERRDYALVS